MVRVRLALEWKKTADFSGIHARAAAVTAAAPIVYILSLFEAVENGEQRRRRPRSSQQETKPLKFKEKAIPTFL